MIRWKAPLAGGAIVAVVALTGFYLSPANGAVGGAGQQKGAAARRRLVHAQELPPQDRRGRAAQAHPDLPARQLRLHRRRLRQAGRAVQEVPAAQDFHITNRQGRVRLVRACKAGACTKQVQPVLAPTAAVNPLAPYFPPFTHFVLLVRENHTFDDYLGDCATTIQAGCNGVVESTNHISSVPDLHTLAKTYALSDSYSTGTQPPSGPNHWWLFSGQSASSSQQQSYPTATGTRVRPVPRRYDGPERRGHQPVHGSDRHGDRQQPVHVHDGR